MSLPADTGVPGVAGAAGVEMSQTQPVEHCPKTMYESDSEAEDVEQLEKVLGPSHKIMWLQSGQGAVHVAKKQESGSKVIRAACGAYLADPVCVAQPPSGAWLCQHRACCKLRLGC